MIQSRKCKAFSTGSFEALLPISCRNVHAGNTTPAIGTPCNNRNSGGLITVVFLLFWGSSQLGFGQKNDVSSVAADQSGATAENAHSSISNNHPDELKQELDAYAIELSKIPAAHSSSRIQ
jgi:hypothetical protein